MANDRAIDPNAVPTQTFDWGAIKWLVTPDSIEGSAKLLIDEAVHHVQETDTFAVPTHATVLLSNASATKAAYLFIVDDAPLQRKMGIYAVFE